MHNRIDVKKAYEGLKAGESDISKQTPEFIMAYEYNAYHEYAFENLEFLLRLSDAKPGNQDYIEKIKALNADYIHNEVLNINAELKSNLKNALDASPINVDTTHSAMQEIKINIINTLNSQFILKKNLCNTFAEPIKKLYNTATDAQFEKFDENSARLIETLCSNSTEKTIGLFKIMVIQAALDNKDAVLIARLIHAAMKHIEVMSGKNYDANKTYKDLVRLLSTSVINSLNKFYEIKYLELLTELDKQSSSLTRKKSQELPKFIFHQEEKQQAYQSKLEKVNQLNKLVAEYKSSQVQHHDDYRTRYDHLVTAREEALTASIEFQKRKMSPKESKVVKALKETKSHTLK